VPKRNLPILIAAFFLLTFSSCTCIYFNTFHNIRKNFNGAEDSRQKDGRDQARGGEVKQYNDAITKASKVLERHPTSSWVDDALYIIGASYYYLGSYDKASRKFLELFANYPNSEFVPRARLLMAKAKLQLKEEAESVVLFEDIFKSDADKSMKAEAARALGEYYFEAKDYTSANEYFNSLIDSLGEESDKLRARLFVADGYFERYRFDKALENYKKGLDYSPDTLQYYRIMFRMAECDYFLNNIAGGLDKLEKLADEEQYYDSLTPIRMKMAEGYEWDGNYTDAINIYDKVVVENPGGDAAAVAYYNLGLIYQYDFEELEKARGYYQKSLEERRNSTVSEEATRRASKLALLDQYAQSSEVGAEEDTTEVLDQARLDQLTQSQFLLGELFYFDLGKPDSALHAYRVLLERYPKSRYAPKALMSMAFIERTEYADSSASDSLLRQVLTKYARYDEAEEVIDMLGLAGTRADTGYAAQIFRRAENYLDRYQELDSTAYYLSLVADSILAADSIRRLDSLQESEEGPPLDSSQIFDSLLTEGMVNLKDTLPGTLDSLTYPDPQRVADSARAADSARFADSLAIAKMERQADSMRVADSIRYAEARRVADSIQNAYRRRVIDSAMAIDSARRADSIKALEKGVDTVTAADSAAADSALSEFREPKPDTSAAQDTAAVLKPQAAAEDSTIVSDSTVAVDSSQVPDSMETVAAVQPEDTMAGTPPAEKPLVLPGDASVTADSTTSEISPVITDTMAVADSINKSESLPLRPPMPTDTGQAGDSTTRPDLTATGDSMAVPGITGIVNPLPKPDSLVTGAATPLRDSTQISKAAEVSLSPVGTEPVEDSLSAAGAEPEPEEPQIDYWGITFKSAKNYIKPNMYALLDSAQYLYHTIIDSFPFSKYSLQSRYVLLWMYDKYLAPGDSSMIFLYKSFADSFPNSEYALAIADEYGIRGEGAQARSRPGSQQQGEQTGEQPVDTGAYAGQELTDEERADSILLASPESKFITDEDGNILEPADKYFLRTEVPFEYPLEALAYNIEDKLYFHIRIDFSGEVVELKLMNETASSELNDRVKETVLNTKFDAARIPPELYDHWFYYTYKVQIPSDLRQR